MDSFIKAQHHHLGKGGINCSCCNNIARKGHDKVDKKLNRVARAKIKAETRNLVAMSNV
jgi:hypothetical protein